jgi:hypothetical protein
MEPFLSDSFRRRHTRSARIKLYLACGAILLFMIGLIALLRLARITSVRIEGLEGRDAVTFSEALTRERNTHVLALLLGNDNYFVWPKKITPLAPKFAEASVIKSLWHHSVQITVRERTRFSIWCGGEGEGFHCAWVDGRGVSFEEAFPSLGQLITTVYDPESPLPAFGAAVLPLQTFQYVRNILIALPSFHIPIQKLSVKRGVDELVAETNKGSLLRFSLRFDPVGNLAGFKELLKKTPLSRIAEADLTVEGKIYTKTR